jgi:hypothetical protein
MSIPDVLQLCSIAIEIIIAIVAVVIATKKQKPFGWFVALTFALYVCFDLSRLSLIPLPPEGMSGLFLVASLSMLGAVWLMYTEK